MGTKGNHCHTFPGHRCDRTAHVSLLSNPWGAKARTIVSASNNMNYTVKLISGPFVAMLSEGPKAFSVIAMPRNEAFYRCTFIPHICTDASRSETPRQSRKTLFLCMAQTGKTFYHIAATVLWSEIVGFRLFICTIQRYV